MKCVLFLFCVFALCISLYETKDFVIGTRTNNLLISTEKVKYRGIPLIKRVKEYTYVDPYHRIIKCGLQLRNLRAYAHHFRTAHPGVSRARRSWTLTSPVMCEHCGKIFHCKTLLRNHMWVHTGQKQFRCAQCGRTFTQKVSMAFHVRAQHSAARPAFECALCGKRLANGGNRARHMLTHTQRSKSYTCDVCGKGFTTPAEELSHFQHVHQKKPWPKRTGARRRQRHTDPAANETADSGTN